MKSHFKTEILRKRNSLSKDEILEKSMAIEKNLESVGKYKAAKTAMFFVSFGSEVYTHDLIKKTIGEKSVVVPKIVNHKIEPSMIIGFDNMVSTNPFGILEPIELMKIAYKNIDVVLVPGIVFDMQGYRLGYGFGFYDVFLKNVPKALKIGLAYDFQVTDNVPREDHDVPVDIIVTEKRIIHCKKNS